MSSASSWVSGVALMKPETRPTCSIVTTPLTLFSKAPTVPPLMGPARKVRETISGTPFSLSLSP
jgi:hypothetical protein